ncbi:MAG TPA: hypothetical protein VMN79_20090 [Casimicrobiaceae bacterium]|nr:hypothetical protein [Casimicrobiaceae bacterium]
MLPRCLVFAIALALPVAALAASPSPSPYAGEASRSIKALSNDEVADYLAGKGMGLARAAELNGYPGPAHVLELADQLGLSQEQRERTRSIFERMQADAKAAGRRLVDEERRLDELFASRDISPAVLHEALESIGLLDAEVREIHLQAHLEESRILSDVQAMKYRHLRGYAGHAAGHGDSAGHDHSH